jgi:PAS domain S-box-containing protein
MERNLRNSIVFLNILYVAGALLLLVIAWFTYSSFHSLLEKDFWVDHTNQVILTAEKELSLLKDAETGTRGYVISGNQVYLQPYFASVDSVSSYLEQLKELTKDNSDQQTRLDTLAEAVNTCLAVFSHVIQLKDKQAQKELESHFALQKGKDSMDRVRVLVQSVIDEENRLLAKRTLSYRNSVLQTRTATYLIVVASLVIDLLIISILRRKNRQKAAYEKVLLEKNQHLELLNEELYTSNESLATANQELASVNEELRASQEELAATNEELMASNNELYRTQQKLNQFNEQLEGRVKQRTQEIEAANHEIRLLLESEKMARVEAANNAQQFSSLLEALPTMAWVADPDGSHYYFNQQWFQYTGANFEDLKGWGWQVYVHPEDRSYTTTQFNEALQTGNTIQITDRIKRVDGVYRWHLIRSLPIRNNSGVIARWVGTATDIDELKGVQDQLQTKNEELERTNWDLDNFVYVASHDLKSPVTNLEGLTYLLSKRLAEKLTVKESELLAMIDTSILKLKRTIDDLTQVARVQKDAGNLLELVVFEQVFREVEGDLDYMIKESGATIIADFRAPALFYVPTHLRTILYNLLSNAIKYSAQDRPIRIVVTTEYKPLYIVMTVQDNGLGMVTEQVNKLFTLFKRFHTHVEGTGIGLYIVKRLVENKGGHIEVRSAPGEGTIFSIFFKSNEQG